MENFFALARSLLAHEAAIQVRDVEALSQRVAELCATQSLVADWWKMLSTFWPAIAARPSGQRSC
jgi:hypothetical protein